MLIFVDIETDGPSPWNGSMLSLGACTLDGKQTFYTEIAPIEDHDFNGKTVEWLKEHGLDRERLMFEGQLPSQAMHKFDVWLTNVANGDRLRFVADNAGFDWQFVSYYLERYIGFNKFGFSPLSLTSINIGLERDAKRAGSYKKLRTVRHSHNALDDALGNAGATRALIEKGLKL